MVVIVRIDQLFFSYSSVIDQFLRLQSLTTFTLL